MRPILLVNVTFTFMVNVEKDSGDIKLLERERDDITRHLTFFLLNKLRFSIINTSMPFWPISVH